jgi:hypothetical protein
MRAEIEIIDRSSLREFAISQSGQLPMPVSLRVMGRRSA